MSIVDFHTHAFPDALADRAIEKLQQSSGKWKARLDGRISSLLASMDAAGIACSVVCPIATAPHQFEGILDWCKQIGSDRIVALGSVHPDVPYPGAQVLQIAEAGLAGIKLHPMYQEFHVDEPRVNSLYDAAAAAGLMVVLHCGCDIAYQGADNAHPRRVAAVLDRHPDLVLVATHMGGWLAWDSVRKHLLGRNVWMETSFSLGFMSPDESAELIRAHGVDKVLFGTDSPWADQTTELEKLRQLPLSDAEKQAILVDNPRRLLRQVRDRHV